MVSLMLAETAESSDSSKANVTVEESAASNQPKFFNYHEFVVTRYRALAQDIVTEHGPEHPICITHFPNIYVPESNEEFRNTRVVRVPRRFESSSTVPTFSTSLPGSEPAALPDFNDKKFVPIGELDGQFFGESSVSPLSIYFQDEQWSEIVSTINSLLAAAYDPMTLRNFFSVTLDFLTLNLWSIIEPYMFTNPLQRVEDYVSSLNQSDYFKSRGISIISPHQSSYLSLDVVIPKPSHS